MKTKKVTSIIVLMFLALTCLGQYIFKDEIKLPCTNVKNQQKTGTCWSFSTTSFIESEILRMSKKDVDLSEMFNVRMSYLDKAQNYILRQGGDRFDRGGLAHDAFRVIKDFGIIPQSAYSGLTEGNDSLNHRELDAVLKAFLDAVIKVGHPSNQWNNAIKGILDSYIGVIPNDFVFEDKNYNPRTFAQMMRINTDDYYSITSFTHHKYNQFFILEIPDNYAHESYFNILLKDLMQIVDVSLEKGYTILWDGDISENGFSQKNGLAILPLDFKKDSVFKSPCKEITVNERNRQENFMSYNTTEDHLMHIVGRAKDQNNDAYYIIKNSWGEKGPYKGFLYMSAPYFMMKTVSITIHKDALPKVILGVLESTK